MTKYHSVKVLLEHLGQRPVLEEVTLRICGSYIDIEEKVQEYVDLLNCDGEIVRLKEIYDYSEPLLTINSEIEEVHSKFLV